MTEQQKKKYENIGSIKKTDPKTAAGLELSILSQVPKDNSIMQEMGRLRRIMEGKENYTEQELNPPKNEYKSFKQLEKEAKQGNVQSMISLGYILEDTAKWEKALYWYEKAAESGSEKAKRYSHRVRRKIQEREEEQANKREAIAWDNPHKIAVLLDAYFPLTDVLSLDDAKLLDMMKEAGILDKLPEIDNDSRRGICLHAVKCSLLRVIEDDEDYDAHQGDAWV